MWGKIARWLLPVSLAFNIFFVVLAVRHHPSWHPGPPDPRHIADSMTSNLPPADAAILQQSFAALHETRKADRDFSDKIRAALIANPFDAEALKAALKEGQADHQAMEDSMAAAFVEAATKMSPEGRAALAAHHHFGPPGGPNGPPPGPPSGPPPPPPN